MKKSLFIKLVALLTIAFLSNMAFLPATCSAKYLNSNYRATSEQTYKGWPIDWWVTYFIQEFDKTAPGHGMDWLHGNSKQNCGPSITDWVPDAIDKGWVVRSLPSYAKVGALAITVNDSSHFARAWIVREVYTWGFKGTYIDKDGEPREQKISYSWLANPGDGFNFKGYIYPERIPK